MQRWLSCLGACSLGAGHLHYCRLFMGAPGFMTGVLAQCVQ